jgi:hypothetical protein
MSWYVNSESKNREAFLASGETRKSIHRFWLNKDTSKEVVFIDDARFGVFEHRVQVNGKWETYTCAGADCLFCTYKKSRYYTEYYTIIDLTRWVNREGKEVRTTRRALGAGKEAAQLLEKRRVDLGGSLAGKKFKVSRFGDRGTSVGNDWSPMPTDRPIDTTRLPPECQPLNFLELLKPLSRQEMENLLSPPAYHNDKMDSGMSEMDIPF